MSLFSVDDPANWIVGAVSAGAMAVLVGAYHLSRVVSHWAGTSQSRRHKEKVHQHEMTVRLSMSDEYERIIASLREDVDRMRETTRERVDMVDKQLEEMRELHRKCEEENRRINSRIDNHLDKTDSAE